MKIAYYNEIEPYAAQWLRNLIAAGESLKPQAARLQFTGYSQVCLSAKSDADFTDDAAARGKDGLAPTDPGALS